MLTPAIKELIHVLVFSKKASKRPLAEQDLDAFNPIPLPLIAYACTAVSFTFFVRRLTIDNH